MKACNSLTCAMSEAWCACFSLSDSHAANTVPAGRDCEPNVALVCLGRPSEQSSFLLRSSLCVTIAQGANTFVPNGGILDLSDSRVVRNSLDQRTHGALIRPTLGQSARQSICSSAPTHSETWARL